MSEFVLLVPIVWMLSRWDVVSRILSGLMERLRRFKFDAHCTDKGARLLIDADFRK